MNETKLQNLLDRENLSIAPMQKRAFAWLLDSILISIVFMLIYSDDFAKISANATNYDALILFIQLKTWQISLLKIIYDSVFIYLYGASLGKMAFKIRTISIDLVDNPTLFNSIIRAVSKFLGESIFFITYFFAFADKFNLALHDRIAKSIVISSESK